MANSLPVYSAREVNCSWGPVDFEGFSGDNILSIEYNSDLTTNTVSCDGKLATSVTPDRTGTITVELMQTSETNAVLSGILAAQEASGDTTIIYRSDFAVTDPSGSVIYIGRNAHLQKAPTMGLGVEQNTYEWTFYCEKVEALQSPRGIGGFINVVNKVKSVIDGFDSLLDRLK